jgi:hypothetical protein
MPRRNPLSPKPNGKPCLPDVLVVVRPTEVGPTGPVIFARVLTVTRYGRISRWQALDSEKPRRYVEGLYFWIVNQPLNDLRLSAAYLHEKPRLEDHFAAASWARRFVLETPQ